MDKKYLEELKRRIQEEKYLGLQFGKYSKIYSMTTENIIEFLKKIDLQGKTVLTVAGSGDQRLNAYLLGASKVTTFDVNPFTKLHMELKDEAIRNINFEKFISFFGIRSAKYSDYYIPLDKRIYEEFCGNLSTETRYIFDYIINNNIPFHNIYYKFDNNLSKLSKMDGFLEKYNYDRLKNMINIEDNFICSNILDLKEKLSGNKYDLILLSNISDYTLLMYGDNDLKKYRELIDSLTDNLNVGGTIQVGYIYSQYDTASFKSPFGYNHIRQKYFPIDLFDTTMVTAYYDKNPFAYDKVITYTRKK